MHKAVKKVLDVAVEEAIRWSLVAVVGGVVAAVLLWWGRHRGVGGLLIDRGITVLLTLAAVAVVASALRFAPTVLKKIASRRTVKKGYLEHWDDMGVATDDLSAVSAQIGSEVKRVLDVYPPGGDFNLPNFGSPESRRRAVELAAKTARRVNRCSRRLHTGLVRLRKVVARFVISQSGMLGWITSIAQADPQLIPRLKRLRESTEGLHKSSIFLANIMTLRQKQYTTAHHPTGELIEAVGRLTPILGGIAEVGGVMVRHSAETISAIDGATQSISGTEAPPPGGA